MNNRSDKPTVFISYSHEDEEWKNRLHPHLKALELEDLIELWDDRKIDEGGNWFPEIKSAMERAAVAVCLISADYLASRFIKDEEISYLLDRRERDGMLLLPVVVRPCFLKPFDWLNRIQRLPRDGKSIAVDYQGKEDEAFRRVAELIYNKISDPAFRLARPAPQWAELSEDHIDVARLPRTGAEVFGRAKELALLDEAWESDTTRIISFVAWGGVGKSALVNKWVERIAEDNYRGARRVYAWSFYSQGTGESVTSADFFIDKALRWFGDSAFADTKRSAWDKGQRLAELVQKEKTLLLLDGLEPLQSGFEHDRGQVNDPALRVLIEELAKKNPGLCVISTREDLPGFDTDGESFLQRNLEQISPEAGRSLLRFRGIRGSDEELEQTTRDFGKHALAINLLAAYLQDMPGQHVSHARLIPDLDIPDIEGRHPRRVMEAFAGKFKDQPELNVLNMMGLFDRPASAREIVALRTQTTIPELTDRIRWLIDEEWERTLQTVRSVHLVAPKSHHDADGLDAHPLVREHFGQRLRERNEEAWKQGHSHLYEYLSKVAPRLPDTLEEMTPLFAAVAHGCKAGRHREAWDDVYYSRIQRGGLAEYCMYQLGAIGPDLAALSGFFEMPWNRAVAALGEMRQALAVHEAGLRLQALGRLREAVEPLQIGLSAALAVQGWENASTATCVLSATLQAFGEISQALDYARQAVDLADQSEEAWVRPRARARLGASLHQAGKSEEAQAAFREAEQEQTELQPKHPILYAMYGFEYCDLLIELGDYQEVHNRATRTVVWAGAHKNLRTVALDHISLARALVMVVQREEASDFAEADDHLRKAVDGLRRSGYQNELARGLLARAEYYRVRGRREGGGGFFERARGDVDEAMTVARRGEMRLFECDCHLEYARLHLAQGEKDEARDHFETAKKMVDEMGYHRRDPEVLLLSTSLEIQEGKPDVARRALAAAKKRIDEMRCHRWDIDVKELEAELET